VVVSHWPPVPQSEFIKHSTQYDSVVSQTAGPPPAHWVLLVQDATQRLVVVLQTVPPSPQSLDELHWTHRFVVVLQ
jgi:hypothetical protein